jgi:hypothetical protein
LPGVLPALSALRLTHRGKGNCSSKREDEYSTSWGSLYSPEGDEIEDLGELHGSILDEGLWAVSARAQRATPADEWEVAVRLLDHSVRERLEQQRQRLDDEVEKELRRFAEGKQWSRVALSYYPRTGPAELIVDTGGAAVEKYSPTEKLAEMLLRVIAPYEEERLDLQTAKWTLKKKLAFREYFA